jgi:predicted DCC family thiol-disulfide oxidoreductase YuxK
MLKPKFPVSIFYDGACRMCVGQMAKYRAKDRQKRLRFFDISAEGFDAASFGLDPELIQHYIYAKDSDGQIVRGVDAFIWIWLATGRVELAFFAGLPLVKQAAKFCYRLVARLRYAWGKQPNDCGFHCAKRL